MFGLVKKISKKKDTLSKKEQSELLEEYVKLAALKSEKSICPFDGNCEYYEKLFFNQDNEAKRADYRFSVCLLYPILCKKIHA